MNAFSSLSLCAHLLSFLETTSECMQQILLIFSLKYFHYAYITTVKRLQLKITDSTIFALFDEKIVLIPFILFQSILFSGQKCPIICDFYIKLSIWIAWTSGCQCLAVSFVCILFSCQFWQLAVWLSRLWVHWSPGFSPTLSGYQDSKGAFQPKLQLQYMHFAHT